MWGRANHAHERANADVPEIQQHPTESDGWDFDYGCISRYGMPGPQMPDSLIPEENEVNDDENIKKEDVAVSSGDESDWTEEDEV